MTGRELYERWNDQGNWTKLSSKSKARWEALAIWHDKEKQRNYYIDATNALVKLGGTVEHTQPLDVPEWIAEQVWIDPVLDEAIAQNAEKFSEEFSSSGSEQPTKELSKKLSQELWARLLTFYRSKSR